MKRTSKDKIITTTTSQFNKVYLVGALCLFLVVTVMHSNQTQAPNSNKEDGIKAYTLMTEAEKILDTVKRTKTRILQDNSIHSHYGPNATVVANRLSIAKKANKEPTAAEFVRSKGFKLETSVGQVNMGTEFGRILYQVTKQDDVELVLETGTWNGGGSSVCLATGLQETSGFLLTLEAVESKWLEAENNLRHLPAKCILGTAVDEYDTTFPSIDNVNKDGGIPGAKQAQWNEWRIGEERVLKSYPIGMLKALCQKLPFDMLYLDSGEFCGPNEFDIALKYCTTARYIALDDTATFKNRTPRKRLLEDPDWELVDENLKDRHGWALFKHKTRPRYN